MPRIESAQQPSHSGHHGMHAGLDYVVSEYLYQNGENRGESVMGAWAVTMMDQYYITAERFIVLTTHALYRIQWAPSVLYRRSGRVKRCRRIPLDDIYRVQHLSSNGGR
eukprot:670485-Prymnesium_polylepis.1